MTTINLESDPARSAEPAVPDLRASAESRPARGELALLWHRYRSRILFTYGLFNVENVLRLAQPLVLGLAINDLLSGAYRGLVIFVIAHLAHLVMRSARQMYDTRAFTAIYTDRASELIARQRQRGVEISRVAARSALARQFVDFLERDVPVVIRSTYSLLGALVLLAWFDWFFAAACLALAIPVAAVNLVYGRTSHRLSRLLHDELENEVRVVATGDGRIAGKHYAQVASWRIKLSDAEAFTTGVMELFILAMMGLVLFRVCTLPGAAAGDIYAVFRYTLLFITALDSLPMLVAQVARLRDIGTRISTR